MCNRPNPIFFRSVTVRGEDGNLECKLYKQKTNEYSLYLTHSQSARYYEKVGACCKYWKTSVISMVNISLVAQAKLVGQNISVLEIK